MRISDRSSDVCSSDLAARWRTVRESRKPSRLSDPDRPQPLGRSDAPPDAGSCRILPSPSRARWRGLPRSDFADRGDGRAPPLSAGGSCPAAPDPTYPRDAPPASSDFRLEEPTSQLQALMRTLYAVFCL